jgi:hypothetical protein
MSRILEQGRNRATPSEAASFVDKFEEMEAEIASERGVFMAKCKAIRERQSELLDDAKSQGVAKKIVKALVKRLSLLRKADEQIDDLEDDDRAYAVDIFQALGGFADLPLGAAAVEREGRQDPTTAAIVQAAAGAWSEDAPA